MPVYAHLCEGCGHHFEDFRPVSLAHQQPACKFCLTDLEVRRDYAAERKQVGMIDGEHSGYYSSALRDKNGRPFPKDPKNPRKRILPNNMAFKDGIKRSEGQREET